MSLWSYRSLKINSYSGLDCLDLTEYFIKNILYFSSCKRPKQSLQSNAILICKIILEMLAADRSQDSRSKLSVGTQYVFVSIGDQDALALRDRWDSDTKKPEEVFL